jgi:hypothetical protein
METLALFSAAMSLGFVSGACVLCRETELAITTATGILSFACSPSFHPSHKESATMAIVLDRIIVDTFCNGTFDSIELEIQPNIVDCGDDELHPGVVVEGDQLSTQQTVAYLINDGGMTSGTIDGFDGVPAIHWTVRPFGVATLQSYGLCGNRADVREVMTTQEALTEAIAVITEERADDTPKGLRARAARRTLQRILEQQGCEEIGANGKNWDEPMLHNVIDVIVFG